MQWHHGTNDYCCQLINHSIFCSDINNNRCKNTLSVDASFHSGWRSRSANSLLERIPWLNKDNRRKHVLPGDFFVTQPQQRSLGVKHWDTSWGEQREWHQSPGVVHDVLHNLVQDLLEESCPHPDVFNGLGGERLRRPAGGGRTLSPQRLVAHTLTSPAGTKGTIQLTIRPPAGTGVVLSCISGRSWTRLLTNTLSLDCIYTFNFLQKHTWYFVVKR